MFNVLNFEAGNLKLDKQAWKDLNIYYIGYVDKKPDWNVNSVNPLHLMINRFYGHIESDYPGENCVKYFIISDIARNKNVLKNMIRCFLELNTISKKLITTIVNMVKITKKLDF